MTRGNAGQGNIYGKDLGAIMPLGNALIFLLFFHWFQIKVKLTESCNSNLLKLRNRLQ